MLLLILIGVATSFYYAVGAGYWHRVRPLGEMAAAARNMPVGILEFSCRCLWPWLIAYDFGKYLTGLTAVEAMDAEKLDPETVKEWMR